LSEALKKHEIRRVYNAIVDGVISEDKGLIDAPVGRHNTDRKKMDVNLRTGRNAVTHFSVLKRYKNATFIELRLETGRTHQIRVHMSYIRHPVAGDEVYGGRSLNLGFEGQVLHARELSFIHPATGKLMEFKTELPEYFEKVFNILN
jgi:23S rRNA pseudouridine1911/1915/1917 synthase